MSPGRVQTLTWVFIYSGLLLLALGLFVMRHDGTLGWVMVGLGAVDALVGVALIVVRSRMTD
jgi:hypothetical protein